MLSVESNEVTEAGQRRSPRWAVIVVCLAAGAFLGVAGTVGAQLLTRNTARDIPVFQSPQHPADVLPGNIPGFDRAFIVAGTSRLVGEADGNAYYLSQARNRAVCLLILPTDGSPRWAQSCSEHLPFSLASADGGSARVATPSTVTPPGAIRLGMNVLVDPTSTSLNR